MRTPHLAELVEPDGRKARPTALFGDLSGSYDPDGRRNPTGCKPDRAGAVGDVVCGLPPEGGGARAPLRSLELAITPLPLPVYQTLPENRHEPVRARASGRFHREFLGLGVEARDAIASIT